jgi:hypothetical protein
LLWLCTFSGIGRETAAELVRRNAHGAFVLSFGAHEKTRHKFNLTVVFLSCVMNAVVLACRSAERGERLKNELYTAGLEAGRKPSIEVSHQRALKNWRNFLASPTWAL